MYKFENFFLNKKILITGHTGFKGSWLTLWLYLLGAKIIGVSKDLPTKPSHFNELKIKKKIIHKKLDITNLKKLHEVFKKHKPDLVFHLAAQSLVKKSYNNPVETYTSNTIGTLNLLECIRKSNHKCSSVFITSDKSYKNLEIERGYHENDLLGGIDPYSSSKASAELIIKTYFECFLKKNTKQRIAIARAGNVVGGGDWSENRLIPDCVKSWSKNKKVFIRNPSSTRPWQHVLEALYGYLILAKRLNKNSNINGEPFNFGPKYSQNKSVLSLLKETKKNWKNVNWKLKKNKKNFYESKLLRLNSSKAKKYLGWTPNLNFEESIKMITSWYKNYLNKEINIFNFSKIQIQEYSSKIKYIKRNN